MNNMEQNTILVDAASKGIVLLVEKALKSGADIHFNQDQAVRCAAENGHAEMVEMLARRGADLNALKGGALRRAVKRNHAGIVEILLKNGADPNVDDGQPLIDSAMRGRVDIIRHLLDHGADTAVSNNMAIGYAAFSGYTDIIRMLIEADADVFSAKSDALYLARSGQHEDVVVLLLAARESQKKTFAANLAFAPDGAAFGAATYLKSRETGLIRAIKMDILDSLLSKMETTGGALDAGMLFDVKDCENLTAASLLVLRGELEKAFRPAFWRNDVNAMSAAYNRLSTAQKENGKLPQERFNAIVAGHNRDVLKEKIGNRFKLKP